MDDDSTPVVKLKKKEKKRSAKSNNPAFEIAVGIKKKWNKVILVVYTNQ